MTKHYKNMLYVSMGIIIGLFLFNSSFANQIYSNLAKGFVAITADDEKKENNLVGLDAGGKLPVDIIPASAETSGNGLYFCNTFWYSSSSEDRISANCPTGYSKLSIEGPANRHEIAISTPSGNMLTTFSNAWSQEVWSAKTICCVKD